MMQVYLMPTLTNANLNSADLTNTDLGYSKLGNADLNNSIDLEKIFLFDSSMKEVSSCQ